MTKKKDFTYYTGKKYDGIMGRCYRETDAAFKNYGGRGIRVCFSWINNISNFRSWLITELDRQCVSVEDFLRSPRNYQIDRIDPDGHYTPENCRLTNTQGNARNKRATKGKVIISAEGIEVTFGEE